MKRSVHSKEVASPVPGDVLAGRYRIERVLGQGYHAVAFLASDTLNRDEPVVVKRGHSHKNWKWQPESDALRLMYPDLWVAAGVDDQDIPYIVSRFRPGYSLEKRSAAAVVPVIADVLGELERLHAYGYAHNDVSPFNLYVSGGKASLLDFGLVSAMFTQAEAEDLEQAKLAAKLATENYFNAPVRERGSGLPGDLKYLREEATKRLLALEGRLAGSGNEAYSAPERFDKLQPDARSDLYSVAATAMDLLTGKPPEHCGPQRYSQHVSPHLASVLDRALTCEPASRYPSAHAMLEDLRSDLQAAMAEQAL